MAKSLRHLHVYRVAPNIRLRYAFHGLTFGVFGKALSRCGGRETGYTRLAWRGGTKKIEIFSLLLFFTLLFRPPLLHTNASLMARFRGGAERGEEGGTQINSVDAES